MCDSSLTYSDVTRALAESTQAGVERLPQNIHEYRMLKYLNHGFIVDMYRYAVYFNSAFANLVTCSARSFELISGPTAAVNASQVPLIEKYILVPAAGVTSFVQHRFPATNTRHPTSGANSGVGLPTHDPM